MDKIKNLPESGAGRGSKKKSSKTWKPVIISFVTAAACLVLAFIVSPQIFGFGNLTNSAESVPMTQSFDTESLTSGDDEILSADMKYTQMETHGSAADSADTGSLPPVSITAPSLAPQPSASTAPSPEPQPSAEATLGTGYGVVGRGSMDDAQTYYAVFEITGQLPDVLVDVQQTDNGDGTFNIEITVEAAQALIEAGYVALEETPDAPVGLVIFTPAG